MTTACEPANCPTAAWQGGLMRPKGSAARAVAKEAMRAETEWDEEWPGG